MKVLLIDFYDSFTYNIQHYLHAHGADVHVVEHDLLEINQMNDFSHIVLSPGPGLPKEKANMFEIIESIPKNTALLGICLGMQAIAEYSGAKLYNLSQVRHGTTAYVKKNEESRLFDGLPEKFEVGLYHSWAVESSTLNYKITAKSDENVVMAIEDIQNRIYGVQFHPESVLTPQGKKMIKNFLFNC